MKSFQEYLSYLVSSTEWVMLLLIIGGGIFLMIYSGFKPYKYFKHAIDLVSGKYSKADDPGEVSHLEALSSAVAATVGLGNISGVAIAIYYGGPGVVFWMWLTAIIGMCIKFYSASLAILFRKDLGNGILQGGPMYYISEGLPKVGKGLAAFFCLAGLVGVLPAFTTNQFTQTLMEVVRPDETLLNLGEFNWRLIIGITLSIITSLVIFGGLKKIVQVATAIVPFMVGIYFIAALYIMSANYTEIIPSFRLIFSEAFNLKTAIQGGLWGLIIIGIRRAVFSNESGVGLAPMYHGQSKTKEPIREGLVAMLGPFIDTIIVCTLTALIIIVSKSYLLAETNGITMTLIAFKHSLFGVGDILLMVLVAAFALSTLFTYSYYGTKCLSFLTDFKIGKWYNVIYILSITFAALASVDVVIGLIDLSFALMSIPNMIAIIYLSPRIKEAMNNYFKTI
ncbi:alanine/glycine:cation symporter family protein [Sungkyunkwania multivorans]|uniref:Alanine/glycine:cation symporter family protein n=1 Tax=Sungkyunkwania multivorans TaxID=1173618 RepID=A0ABW3D140_9FLAO